MSAVKGRAAHAGFEPEKGIHAIQTAARAIAALKLGHVDEETTLNVGLISGGSVVNAVPELCTCRGEIRSYSHEKAMETLEDVRAVFETAVKEAGAELGASGIMQQQSMIEMITAKLDMQIQNADEEYRTKGRMYKAIGGFCGACAVILLI